MADFDWKKLVGALAPTLGTALGGPLVGSAISVLSNAILGKADGTEGELSAAVMQGLTPDAIVKLREADNDFKARMREMDIDLAKLNQATELAYVADVANARTANGGDPGVFRLGIAVLVTFAVLMGLVLWGCFQLLTGQLKMDPATAAMVSGLVGTVIGYVAANAQQVTSYYFGSSRGSSEKTDRMAETMANTIKQLGAKPS